MQTTQHPPNRRPARAATRRFYSLCIGQNTQKASQRHSSPRQRRNVDTSKTISNVTRKTRPPARKNVTTKDDAAHSRGRVARRGHRSLDEETNSSNQEGEIGGGARSSEAGGSRDVKAYCIGVTSLAKTKEEAHEKDQESCSSSLSPPLDSHHSQSNDHREESESISTENPCEITSPPMSVDILRYLPPASSLTADPDMLVHLKTQHLRESEVRTIIGVSGSIPSNTDRLHSSGVSGQHNHSLHALPTTPSVAANNHPHSHHSNSRAPPSVTEQSTRSLQRNSVFISHSEREFVDSESANSSSAEEPPCSIERLPNQVVPLSSTPPIATHTSNHLVQNVTDSNDNLRGSLVRLQHADHLCSTRHEEATSSPSIPILGRPSSLPSVTSCGGGVGGGHPIGAEKPSQLLQLPQLLQLLLNKQTNPTIPGGQPSHPSFSAASLACQDNNEANSLSPGGGISVTDVAAQLARNLISLQSHPGRAGAAVLFSPPPAQVGGGGGNHTHPFSTRCDTGTLCSSSATTSWPPTSPYSSSPPAQQGLLFGPCSADPFDTTTYNHKGFRGDCPQSGLGVYSDTTRLAERSGVSPSQSDPCSSSSATLPVHILMECPTSARTKSHPKHSDLLPPVELQSARGTTEGLSQKGTAADTTPFGTNPHQSSGGTAAMLAHPSGTSTMSLSSLSASGRHESDVLSSRTHDKMLSTPSVNPAASPQQTGEEEHLFPCYERRQHQKGSLPGQESGSSFREGEEQWPEKQPGGGNMTSEAIPEGEQNNRHASADEMGDGNNHISRLVHRQASPDSQLTMNHFKVPVSHVSENSLDASRKSLSSGALHNDPRCHGECREKKGTCREDDSTVIVETHRTDETAVTARTETLAGITKGAPVSAIVNKIPEKDSGTGETTQARPSENKGTQDTVCVKERNESSQRKGQQEEKKENSGFVCSGSVDERKEITAEQQFRPSQEIADKETECERQETREPRSLPVSEFLKKHYRGPELPSHPSCAMSFGTSSESEGELSTEKGGGGGGWTKKKRKERRVSLGASDALWQPHFHPHNQEFRVRYRYKGSMRLKTISCARFGREGAKRLTAAFVERWRLSGRFVAAKTHRSRLALVDLPQDTQLLPSYDKKRAPSPLTGSSLLFQLSHSPSLFSFPSTFLGQSPPFPPLNPTVGAATVPSPPHSRPGLFLGSNRVAPFQAWQCKPSPPWGGEGSCESSNGGVGNVGEQASLSSVGNDDLFDICTLTQGGFRAGGMESTTAAATLEAKPNGLFRGTLPLGAAVSSCLPGGLSHNILGPPPRTASSFSPTINQSSSVCSIPHTTLPHTLTAASGGRVRSSPGAASNPLFASATSSTHSRPASGGEGPTSLVTPLQHSSIQVATSRSSPSTAGVHHNTPALPCPTLASLLNPLLPACKRPRVSARALEAPERGPPSPTPTDSLGAQQQAILHRLHQQNQFFGKGAEPTATIALEHSVRPTAAELFPFLRHQSQFKLPAACVAQEDGRHATRHIPDTLVRAVPPTSSPDNNPQSETTAPHSPQLIHQNWEAVNGCPTGIVPEIGHQQILFPGREWNREENHSFAPKCEEPSSSPSVAMEETQARPPGHECHVESSAFARHHTLATGSAAALPVKKSLDSDDSDTTTVAFDTPNALGVTETVAERRTRHPPVFPVNVSPSLPRTGGTAQNRIGEGELPPSPQCHESSEAALPQSHHSSRWQGEEGLTRAGQGALGNSHTDLPCSGGADERQNAVSTTTRLTPSTGIGQIQLRSSTVATGAGFLENHEGPKFSAQAVHGTASQQPLPVPLHSRSYWQVHGPPPRIPWNNGWPAGVNVSRSAQQLDGIVMPLAIPSVAPAYQTGGGVYQKNNESSSCPLISSPVMQPKLNQDLYGPGRGEFEKQSSFCRAELLAVAKEQDLTSASVPPFPRGECGRLQDMKDVNGLDVHNKGGSSASEVKRGPFTGASVGPAHYRFEDSPTTEESGNTGFTSATCTTARCSSQLSEANVSASQDEAEDCVSSVCFAGEGTACDENSGHTNTGSKTASVHSLRNGDIEETARPVGGQSPSEKDIPDDFSSAFLNASRSLGERPKSPRHGSPARPSTGTRVGEAAASSSSA